MRIATATIALTVACGGSAAPQQPAPSPTDAPTEVPAGYGTLRRDDIVVRLATGTVEVQVLPLGEGVIRLLRPDTYQALTNLVQSRRQDILAAARRAGVAEPTLVMVTFLGVVPQARFTPEDLTITSRGRLFRPVCFVTISPAWSSYQLEAREQAAALYLFESGIPFRDQLRISYQTMSSDGWTRSAAALDRERSAVLVRAQAGRPPTPVSPDTTPPR